MCPNPFDPHWQLTMFWFWFWFQVQISLVRSSCKQAIKELNQWMAPVKVTNPITLT
jgi:hypothetical protein